MLNTVPILSIITFIPLFAATCLMGMSYLSRKDGKGQIEKTRRVLHLSRHWLCSYFHCCWYPGLIGGRQISSSLRNMPGLAASNTAWALTVFPSFLFCSPPS